MSAENYFPDELSRDEFVRGPRRCDYASNLEWFTEQRTLAESVLCPYRGLLIGCMRLGGRGLETRVRRGFMMSVRKWLAWKLVRLAARIYDAEWYESIEIRTPSGDKLEISVIADEYGCGISSTSNIFWDCNGLPPPLVVADVEGWRFIWTDRVRAADEEAS